MVSRRVIPRFVGGPDGFCREARHLSLFLGMAFSPRRVPVDKREGVVKRTLLRGAAMKHQKIIGGGSVRLLQLIDELFSKPVITVGQYKNRVGVSYPTARLDLKNHSTQPAFTISIAALPARSSDAPLSHRCAALPPNSPSTRNTTLPADPHHRSASIAGCASILPTVESSSPDPAAKTLSQTPGKS